MIDFSDLSALVMRYVRSSRTAFGAGIPDPLPPGPPAIAIARRVAARRSDIIIDPLETEFRVDEGRLLVRSWLVIPSAGVSAPLFKSLAETDECLRPLDSETKQIFFLSTSYGFSSSQIALLRRQSRRHVRRSLLKAIAQLDRRAR